MTALRLAAAAAALALAVWRVGAGPFFQGVRDVDGRALLLATGLGAVATVCCAWRWTVVARGFGVRLLLPAAVAAYYRSVFLNLTLPGGVVGDVHRGLRHGALRTVVWERSAGQVVQAVLTVAVLLALPSPVGSWMPYAAAALAATALALAAAAKRTRAGPLRHNATAAVAVASTVVVLCHAVTFLVAARTAGVDAPVSRLLPLALLAMLGMTLPSIAGWGPREGVTAWVFASAGLGADRGVATAVTYGVMALAASLPGALVLVAGLMPRRRSTLEGACDA